MQPGQHANHMDTGQLFLSMSPISLGPHFQGTFPVILSSLSSPKSGDFFLLFPEWLRPFWLLYQKDHRLGG